MPKETTPSVAKQADEHAACPFCGGTPRYLSHLAGFHDERVICDPCGFFLAPEAWDRRASQAASHSAPEPVAWLRFWAWQGFGNAESGPDNETGYELCKPTDKGIDGSDAFPVYAAPLGAESKACASVGVREKLQELHDSITPGGSHPNREWGDIHRDGMRDGIQKAIAALASPAPSVGEPVLFQNKPIAWLTPDLRHVASNLAIEQARRGGSVVAGSLANYSVPAYRRATPPAAPAVTEGANDINWKVVGVLIEAHMTASRHHTAGTSNWGAALYKALRREFPPKP